MMRSPLTPLLMPSTCLLHPGTLPQSWSRAPPRWERVTLEGVQGEVSSPHSIPPLQSPHQSLGPPGRSLDGDVGSPKLLGTSGVSEDQAGGCGSKFPKGVSAALYPTIPGHCYLCLLVQSLHALPGLRHSFFTTPWPCFPCPPHPTARLWSRGLASGSITEDGWMTSVRLDCPLWWVGRVGHCWICKERARRWRILCCQKQPAVKWTEEGFAGFILILSTSTRTLSTKTESLSCVWVASSMDLDSDDSWN